MLKPSRQLGPFTIGKGRGWESSLINPMNQNLVFKLLQIVVLKLIFAYTIHCSVNFRNSSQNNSKLHFNIFFNYLALTCYELKDLTRKDQFLDDSAQRPN